MPKCFICDSYLSINPYTQRIYSYTTIYGGACCSTMCALRYHHKSVHAIRIQTWWRGVSLRSL